MTPSQSVVFKHLEHIKETTGTIWNTGGSFWISENALHCEGDWALTQNAQGCCGASVLGGVQKLSGQGSRQPALGGFPWTGGLDKMICRDIFWSQPLCVSVIEDKDDPKEDALTLTLP